VIAYPILLFSDLFGPFLDPGAHRDGIEWIKVTLVSFVFLYSLSDAVETRLMTHCFPYKGRGRFTVDIGIAVAFILAFAGAAKASVNFLVPFGVTFVLGAVWGIYLHGDSKKTCSWQYPKAVVLSHFGAATIWLAYWWSMRRQGLTVLGWAEVSRLIWYYGLWLGISTAAKELYRVPAVEADLFPTSLIDVGARKIIKFFREG
jgi:hypothetical protein